MKDLGFRVYGSNPCYEIHLPTDDDTEAICCVSSLNVEYYRDWTEQFVRDIEEIFKTWKQYAEKETLLLGKKRGERYSMRNTGRRNSHLLAIASTSNRSTANCSSSIEPVIANAFTPKSRAGTFFVKNKYLKELERLNMNDRKTWSSISNNKGSVNHLDIPIERLLRSIHLKL